MASNDKLTQLKTFLGISDSSQDTLLHEYLDMAKAEILNWLYSNIGEVPATVVDLPKRYEQVQIQACVVGFNLGGVEGESKRTENSVTRDFNYSDMLDYIHRNVFPLVGA